MSVCVEKTSKFFSQENLKSIADGSIPQHVAIVMDGNRRWAKRQASGTPEGHRSGADTLMDAVEAARDLGVKVLTVYAFSTENKSRSAEEVGAIMMLLKSYLITQRCEMLRQEVRFDTIGDLTALPQEVREVLDESRSATAHCTGITLVMALNYGGRQEIVRAVRQLVDDYELGKIKRNDITEDALSNYMDTRAWPDPDLWIRTGGEMRISNFMLWQVSYSEIYVTETLWPDFTPHHLLEAVVEYQGRERRFGT